MVGFLFVGVGGGRVTGGRRLRFFAFPPDAARLLQLLEYPFHDTSILRGIRLNF